jgi:hypothetical protein
MNFTHMLYDCLWFDTEKLAQDADMTGIARNEFARILLAHELAHVITINRFVAVLKREDAQAWAFNKRRVYRRESAALKVWR